jgi:hypothetical protein
MQVRYIKPNFSNNKKITFSPNLFAYIQLAAQENLSKITYKIANIDFEDKGSNAM